MTNFEVIKSMDVDTMSRFLINPIMCYKPCRYDCDNEYLNSECISCIREWLGHDAEKGDGLAKGKSTILKTMPTQDKTLADIKAGKGLAYFDAKAPIDEDNPPIGIYVWNSR